MLIFGILTRHNFFMMKVLLKQFFNQALLFCLFVTVAYSQGIVVSGTVKDQKGEPLSGVSVNVKGTLTGGITDVNGKYTLRTPAAASLLVFSYTGYATVELRAPANRQLNVSLKEALNNLQEVVVTGFRQQTKAEQTSAISTIKASDLMKAPVSDVTNAITGRMVGVMTRQPRGRPGASAAQIFIRGRASGNSAALIIVDGVERETFGDIDPNDIETITTLKDAASTALFGLKGANGVIVVTTKRGKEGRISISFNSSVGVQTFGQRPKPLRSYESAMLLNEGQENLLAIGTPNITKVFTAQDIETFRKGDGDPLLYPDVDWFDALTRKSWIRTQHNLSFRGGSKRAAFFISLGYMFEDGIFKQFNTPSGYTTSPYANRTNFRSNLDYNLTKTTKLSLNLAGRVESEYTIRPIASYNDPIGTILSGAEAMFDKVSTMEPWGAPFFPEHTKRSTPEQIRLDDTYNQIGNVGFPGTGINESPYISLKKGGYSMQERNVLESTFILSQELNMITKGLNFTGSFAYDQNTEAVRVQRGSGTIYGVNRTTKELYNLFGTNPTELQIEDGFDDRPSNTSGRLKTNLQLNLNYTRQFGVHKVSGAVVGTRELQPISGAAPIAFQGLVYRSSYNFKDKYFVEFNGTYQGSENYPKGERYGFFPTVGLNYTVTQEKFMDGIKDAVQLDYLRFRASYGMVGFGNTGGRFLYLDSYGAPTSGGHYTSANGGLGNGYFGNPANIGSSNWDPRPGGAGTRPTLGQNVPVILHTNIGNPFITWEKSLKRNLGMDANFLQNRIQLIADVFDETRSDILLSRNASTPIIYGEPVPSTNFGKNYNGGIEVELRLINRSGPFEYGINMQFSHIKNKRLIVDEPAQQPDNLKVAGSAINQFRGYPVLPGFYQTQAEADAAPQFSGFRYMAGEIRFRDTNGDGIIDLNDFTNIGYSDLPIDQYSAEPHMSYKSWRLSALFQAVDKVSNPANLGGGSPFYEHSLDRWTPSNPNGSVPAIRSGGGPANVYFSSGTAINEFHLQDASYIKLRNVSLSYQFPSNFISRFRVQGANLSFTGSNLYTWTNFIGLDPETNDTRDVGVGNYTSRLVTYPNTRTYQLNLRVNF